MPFLRGAIYLATVPGIEEPKYFVVVSNNGRNRVLPGALALRITTSLKPNLPSIIEIPHGEPVTGRVLCDDIYEIYPEDVHNENGGFTAATMELIDSGLRAALAL